MFNVTLGLKAYGGFSLGSAFLPIAITQGQHCKLGLIFRDNDHRAITITSYTLKLRIKKSDNSILVLTAVPVNNTGGEVEFTLTNTDTSSLPTGNGQSAELEVYLTATPTTTSFYTIPQAISVAAQILTPA